MISQGSLGKIGCRHRNNKKSSSITITPNLREKLHAIYAIGKSKISLCIIFCHKKDKGKTTEEEE
jgi:hypothetical protein